MWPTINHRAHWTEGLPLYSQGDSLPMSCRWKKLCALCLPNKKEGNAVENFMAEVYRESHMIPTLVQKAEKQYTDFFPLGVVE